MSLGAEWQQCRDGEVFARSQKTNQDPRADQRSSGEQKMSPRLGGGAGTTSRHRVLPVMSERIAVFVKLGTKLVITISHRHISASRLDHV